MIRLKLPFQKKRVRTPGIEKALRPYFTRREFKLLKTGCVDFRMLLQKAAQALQVSEADLAAAVAARLKIQYLHSIMPVEYAPGYGASDFRKFGCIPVYKEGRLAGIACADPGKTSQFTALSGATPRFLARWSTIAEALERSEHRDEASSEANLPERVSELVHKAIALVVAQAQSHGRDEAFIEFGERISYSFIGRSGGRASGEIHDAVRRTLMSALELQAGGRPIKTALPDGSYADVTVGKAGDSKYRLVRDQPREIECCDTHIPRSQPAAPAEIGGEQNYSIMLVEDNNVFAKVLEKFFAKQNMQVTHFDDASSALETLRGGQVRPDLILSDIHMPNMNGLEFVKRLRAEPSFGTLPVVIITSDHAGDLELRLFEEGADGFVSKSEDPRLLAAKVKRLLSRAPGRRAA